MTIFLNSEKQLRNSWWVAVFFVVLAALTVPFIMLSQRYRWEITMVHQALIVVAASWISQRLRGGKLSELVGAFNLTWIKDFLVGLSIGAMLMILPAFFLFVCGYVTWETTSVSNVAIISATGSFILVAIAEEFLFRGFVFQRLIAGIGTWAAQLTVAAYFLLIHLNNPGMNGSIKVFAGVNIFIASLLFGLAFIRTKSLAMPLALHFMANWVQGSLLGFGVSGHEDAGLLKPVFHHAPEWLTGGSFGLEASLPGLISVVATTVFLYKWKQPSYRKSLQEMPSETGTIQTTKQSQNLVSSGTNDHFADESPGIVSTARHAR